VIVLILAVILDYLIGDPWGWIHPVQIIGWIISKYSQFIINNISSKILRKIAGIILGLTLILGSGILVFFIIQLTNKINYWLALILQIILLASCFAGCSLKLAALDVLKPLEEDNIIEARKKLSLYVGRDTQNLSSSEILRAILETVAENTTDGVTAPLFYAIVGALIPGVGSVPLAIAYKAASTLDSMIGYKKEPYIDIGWFSAKLEDYLTLIPCRLTVLTLALISGKPKQVISECQIDAIKDPSPNSGWSESVYAAILEVQLGGVNTYQGDIKNKPLLGSPTYPITPEKIYKSLQLTNHCFLIWLTLGIVSLLLLEFYK
jgi:adenosylcobinamide-phosphate synthase